MRKIFLVLALCSLLFAQSDAEAQERKNKKVVCSYFTIAEGLGFFTGKASCGLFIGVVKNISAVSTSSTHEGFRKMCLELKNEPKQNILSTMIDPFNGFSLLLVKRL